MDGPFEQKDTFRKLHCYLLSKEQFVNDQDFQMRYSSLPRKLEIDNDPMPWSLTSQSSLCGNCKYGIKIDLSISAEEFINVPSLQRS